MNNDEKAGTKASEKEPLIGQTSVNKLPIIIVVILSFFYSVFLRTLLLNCWL